VAKFRLVYSGLFQKRVIELLEEARGENRLDEVRPILLELIDTVETNPLASGELIYHLKHSGWPVLHLTKAPWSLHYAVDEAQQVVYLSSIGLMGNSSSSNSD
jgi:hypothetical protein